MLKADPPDFRGTVVILHFLPAFSRRFCARVREVRRTFDSPKPSPSATLSPEVMNEFQVIESALKGAARRRRLERAWRGFWRGPPGGSPLLLLPTRPVQNFSPAATLRPAARVTAAPVVPSAPLP